MLHRCNQLAPTEVPTHPLGEPMCLDVYTAYVIIGVRIWETDLASGILKLAASLCVMCNLAKPRAHLVTRCYMCKCDVTVLKCVRGGVGGC